jgi:hypothetical protein
MLCCSLHALQLGWASLVFIFREAGHYWDVFGCKSILFLASNKKTGVWLSDPFLNLDPYIWKSAGEMFTFARLIAECRATISSHLSSQSGEELHRRASKWRHQCRSLPYNGCKRASSFSPSWSWPSPFLRWHWVLQTLELVAKIFELVVDFNLSSGCGR